MGLEYNGWTLRCDERTGCNSNDYQKIYADPWDVLDEEEVYEQWERDGGLVEEDRQGDLTVLVCSYCLAERARVDKIKASGVLYNEKYEPLDTPLF